MKTDRRRFDLSLVTVRRARPADKATVLDFCRHTFGRWGDYLPEVWDRWVREKKGLLMVAEVRGTPVGVGKITVQRPGVLWLEGLRVDPIWRGHGIGRVIQDFTWRKAMALRPRVVRYATGSYNKISQHLGKSKAMRIAAEFDEYAARPLSARETQLVPATANDLDAVLRLFQRDAFCNHWHGLMLEGWVARSFDRDMLRQLITEGRVYSYSDGRGLAGALVHLQSQDRKYSNYCRVAARDRATFRLVLREGRKLAALLGAQKMEMHLPHALRGKKLTAGTGWRSAMPIWMVVLEWRKQ
ncbi:MAG TPA: GNAT family N-acetyltransferase [Candidatus Edwardsbacteria bacterium]|nr:GNAT family N-acetyltransferase [Candidatus Edwardsbacteria bacterium]